MDSVPTAVPEAPAGLPSPGQGLTQQEAEERLRQFGPNDPSPRRRGAAVLELLLLFVNPLVIILLIASCISVAVGQGTDAGIILVIAVSSATAPGARFKSSANMSARRPQFCATEVGGICRARNWCRAISCGFRQATSCPAMDLWWSRATCTFNKPP